MMIWTGILIYFALIFYPAFIAVVARNNIIIFGNILLAFLIYLCRFLPDSDPIRFVEFLPLFIIWLGLLIWSLRNAFFKYNQLMSKSLLIFIVAVFFIMPFVIVKKFVIKRGIIGHCTPEAMKAMKEMGDIGDQYTVGNMNVHNIIRTSAGRAAAAVERGNNMNGQAISAQSPEVNPIPAPSQ